MAFTMGTIDENPIIFHGRVVIKIVMPDGKIQPFYKSSGRNSGQKDTWFPFDGACNYRNWFIKDRYGVRGENGNALPLHRFGNERLKEISDFLSVLDVSSARPVTHMFEINMYLFNSKHTEYEQLANLIGKHGITEKEEVSQKD